MSTDDAIGFPCKSHWVMGMITCDIVFTNSDSANLPAGDIVLTMSGSPNLLKLDFEITTFDKLHDVLQLT